MKTIQYSPKGIAIADSVAEELAKLFLTSSEESIHISTDNFIYATRALVRGGLVLHNEVRFKFGRRIIKLNEDARFLTQPLPNGFCDHTDKWLMRIL